MDALFVIWVFLAIVFGLAGGEIAHGRGNSANRGFATGFLLGPLGLILLALQDRSPRVEAAYRMCVFKETRRLRAALAQAEEAAEAERRQAEAEAAARRKALQEAAERAEAEARTRAENERISAAKRAAAVAAEEAETARLKAQADAKFEQALAPVLQPPKRRPWDPGEQTHGDVR